MPAALRKKQAVVEVAPSTDDPRAALVAAIEAEQKAKDVVVAKLEALVRARDGILAAEAHLEKSRAAIAKAKETDIKTASTNLDRGVTGVAPWHLNSAVSDVERSEVALDIADGAHKRKREEVAVVEDDKAETTNDKLVCIKQVTKSDFIEYMEELQQLRRRTAIVTRVLSEYLNDDPKFAPHFHDAMKDFRAIAAREAVFADIKDTAARLLSGPSNDDFEAGLAASKAVKAALQELQHNPSVTLPKV
jgi:hypothetical protein